MNNISQRPIGKPILIILGIIIIAVLGLVYVSDQVSNKPISNSSSSVLGNQIQTNNNQRQQTVKTTPTTTSKTIKPSDKSLRLATYTFAVAKGNQRTEFINKYSNGKNDLAHAVNNLALLLDSKPELLASVEKVIALDLAQKSARSTQEDNNTVSTNNGTYTTGDQDKNVGNSVWPKEISPKPGFIQEGSQHTDSLGNTYFYNDDGTTGTAHTDSLGNTYYNDNSGYSSTTSRDSLGNTYTTDNLGNYINSSTDSLGNTYYSGDNGSSGTSHKDSLGNTYYNDNYGNNITCHTDSLGNRTCY